MPPRKQPQNLMTFCIEVLAKVFLDIVANIEVNFNQNDNSSKNTSSCVLSDYDIHSTKNNIDIRCLREESELKKNKLHCRCLHSIRNGY